MRISIPHLLFGIICAFASSNAVVSAEGASEIMRELRDQIIEQDSIEAVEELIGIAKGKNGFRGYQAQAIATIRIATKKNPDKFYPLVFPALLEFLDDPNPSVRREAALTVGIFGEKAEPAIPLLLERMKLDKGMDIELFAAESLGEIGLQPEIVVPVLIKMVPSRKPDGKPRWARGPELDAIGKFGKDGEMAVAALEKALEDSENSYALRAAKALAKIDPQNCSLKKFLVETFYQGNDSERLLVLFTIREIPESCWASDYRTILEKATKDENAEIQGVAADILSG